LVCEGFPTGVAFGEGPELSSECDEQFVEGGKHVLHGKFMGAGAVLLDIKCCMYEHHES
jgi:hypothetical protein